MVRKGFERTGSGFAGEGSLGFPFKPIESGDGFFPGGSVLRVFALIGSDHVLVRSVLEKVLILPVKGIGEEGAGVFQGGLSGGLGWMIPPIIIHSCG
jgi:hypothetical protein